MPSSRPSCLAALLLCILASRASAQADKPQSPAGLQGSLAFGGGDKLGFTGTGTLGPRLGTNLISIRGTWGSGLTDSLGIKKHPVTELALLYGRRFCSPGACYSFGIGPGLVNQLVHTTAGVWQRQYNGGVSFQMALQGTVTPTTTLGLTFIGNRNSAQNFWGMFLGVQFGMPRQSTVDSGDDE